MNINSNKTISINSLENVLKIGKGGRENSLAWAIQKNELIKKIYLAPGNAGSIRINKSKRISFDLINTKELIKKINSGLDQNDSSLDVDWRATR